MYKGKKGSLTSAYCMWDIHVYHKHSTLESNFRLIMCEVKFPTTINIIILLN